MVWAPWGKLQWPGVAVGMDYVHCEQIRADLERTKPLQVSIRTDAKHGRLTPLHHWHSELPLPLPLASKKRFARLVLVWAPRAWLASAQPKHR